ncbi:MAG: NADP-dependent malic enzyme [Cryomorphaceae bacterium]|nr:NADP-dependent malic enzyme [Cryomorphaceae bacterium]
MSKVLNKKDILDYHSQGRPGKIEVIPSKPSNSQRDLATAYSPGVAEPCKEIAKNPDDAYKYTAKGNLVAVISNGTAVLGLGDIGPLASKPVMEGKGLLFKIFSDIDVFDIEMDTKDPEKFVEAVKIMSPTFGGINLEDISAPDCFYIEKRLRDELDIPVMHDDQHGTAIISGAALINALHVVKKKVNKVKVVFNGAGASAISCAKLYLSLGVKKENLTMLDSKGVISIDRTDLTEEKTFFARKTRRKTLEEAIDGADVFVGLSRGNILTQDMIRSMAKKPIVFALANPDPEIAYNKAVSVRKDLIMATGRSDHPNQVNNVLGFPFIFRGALDVRAKSINEEMKLAAVHALAALAREPVPEIVNIAYNQRNLQFGPNYIIPKPFDPRLIYTIAPAVAKAAMESGVAQNPIDNWDDYREGLINRLGRDDKFIRLAIERARANPKRVVLPEADTFKVLKAAQIALDEGIAIPILLGKRKTIEQIIKEYQLTGLEDCTIIDPKEEGPINDKYAEAFWLHRKRRGVTRVDAKKMMRERNFFGSMMLREGDADVFISGTTRKYPEVAKNVFQTIGTAPGVSKAAGMYIMLTKRGPLFFSDTTINVNPTVEDLVEITVHTSKILRRINLKPKVALLSFSNFGSHEGDVPRKMRDAANILRRDYPEIVVDGEMQANFAINNDLLKENFPFSDLVGNRPNIFIFPSLASGNIAYKLLQEFGAAEAVGPILLGLNKPAHILQMGCSVREIVNMIAIGVVDAQTRENDS